MADLQKIASTSSIDLQPVGSLQERDHGRLVDILQQEVGDDAAMLLAEPVSNREGSRTDWYARCTSRVVPLSSLPDEERQETRNRLSDLEQRIEALIARLAASARPDDRHLATALTNCLIVPDESFIYVTPTRDAILTGWGFTRAHRPGYRGGLAKIAPMKPVILNEGISAIYEPTAEATAPPPLTEPSRRRWSPALLLLWLLFALLVAAILFLLLRACAFGIAIPGIDVALCPAATSGAAQQSSVLDLQREMAALEATLLQRSDDCATKGATFVPGAVAQIGSSADLDSRLQERNAQGGAVQISLFWNGPADLDLSVTCTNATVYFSEKSNCGGTLDVDSNTSSTPSTNPVENIFWADASAVPQEALPIRVTLYATRGETADPIPYRIRILRTPPTGAPSEQLIDGLASVSATGQPTVVGQVNP